MPYDRLSQQLLRFLLLNRAGSLSYLLSYHIIYHLDVDHVVLVFH